MRLRRSLVSFSTGWVFLSTMLALRVLSCTRKKSYVVDLMIQSL
jgi:hypothetical protein